jgi:hypothetical protein
MRQLVTSQLLAFHRHRRKAAAVLALKILAVAALVAVLSLQLTAILQQDQDGPPTLGPYTILFLLYFLFYIFKKSVFLLSLPSSQTLMHSSLVANGKCN